MSDWRNLAFYRFVDLDSDLLQIKARVREFCAARNLRGTVLLAPEGVNGMLSGTAAQIVEARAFLAQEFGISDSDCKEGVVENHSFNRLLVKIKKEIIPVGDPSIRPTEFTGQRLEAEKLKQWLDEGQDVVLLDTRNDYEVEVGTFRGAEDWGLDHFREFAARAEREAERLRGKKVVSFCTGGIRCEKASAVLLKNGVKDVYQLEGGILRYFEKVGGAHFDGNCFVFDQRDAVDASLKPAPRSLNPAARFGRHIKNSLL